MGNVNLQVVTAAGSASVWAYLATIVVYLLNGLIFHCWIDPDAATSGGSAIAAVWTCPMHLPSFVTTALQGILTAGGTFLVGYYTPNTNKGS